MNPNKQKRFAVIGNPIAHSLSPAIYMAAFKAVDENAVFIALKIIDVRKALADLKRKRFSGLAVTIPHKETIVPFLDWLEPNARAIGAVNTVVEKNGQLYGYNTDWLGAIRALKEEASLAGKKIILLGAGGAAKAIVFSLQKEKAKIIILNRTLAKAQELAAKFEAVADSIDKIGSYQADIIINATSLGLKETDPLPIPGKYLKRKMMVFDCIYNPKKTKLIKVAEKIGCKIIYGQQMFLYQAADQFRLFTDKRAPIVIMKEALLRNLKK